jgi:hypothetical protein
MTPPKHLQKKKKLTVSERVEQLIPDLWDYVKENCKSLESWKHYDSIRDWVVEDVGAIFREQVRIAEEKLEEERKRSAVLRAKLSRSRESLRQLKEEINGPK